MVAGAQRAARTRPDRCPAHTDRRRRRCQRAELSRFDGRSALCPREVLFLVAFLTGPRKDLLRPLPFDAPVMRPCLLFLCVQFLLALPSIEGASIGARLV